MILLVVFLGVRAWTQRGVVEGAAPPLAGRLLDGGRASLAALRGRPVLVHFWATWCPVCRLEQSSVQALADAGYAVLGVAMQSGGRTEVRAFLREQGLSFPVLVDAHGALARRFGVRGVPTSFVVGPQGRIRFVEVGYTSELGLRARLWLVR